MDAGSALMDSFAKLLTQGLNETLFFDEELEESHRKKALAARAATQHSTDQFTPTSSKSSIGQQVRARRQDAGQQLHASPPLSRRDVGPRVQPAHQLDRAHSRIKHKMQLVQSQPKMEAPEPLWQEQEEVVTEEAEEDQGSGLLDVFIGFGARATELLHTLDQGFDEIFDPSPTKPRQQQQQQQQQQASGIPSPQQQRQENTLSPNRPAKAVLWPEPFEHPSPAALDGLPAADALLLPRTPPSPTQTHTSTALPDGCAQNTYSSPGSCRTTPTKQQRTQQQPQPQGLRSGGRKRVGHCGNLVKALAPRSEVDKVQGAGMVPPKGLGAAGKDAWEHASTNTARTRAKGNAAQVSKQRMHGSLAAEEWGSMAWGESSDEWDSPGKPHHDDVNHPQMPRETQQQQRQQQLKPLGSGSRGLDREWGSGASSGSSATAGSAQKAATACEAGRSTGSTSTRGGSSGSRKDSSSGATAEQGDPLCGRESSSSTRSSGHAHAVMASWQQGAQPQGLPPALTSVSEHGRPVSKVLRRGLSSALQQGKHQEAQEQHAQRQQQGQQQQQQQQRIDDGGEVACAGCCRLAQELQQARQECQELKEDCHRLRSRSVVGSLEEDPCLSEAIRQQLECLMAEKARLAEDNHRLTRENAGLQQLLEYMECGCFGDGLAGDNLEPQEEAQGGSYDVVAGSWGPVDEGAQGCVGEQDLLRCYSSPTCLDEGVQQQQQQQQWQHMHMFPTGPNVSECALHPQQEQQGWPQAAAAAAAAAAPRSGPEDLDSLSQIWSQALASCTTPSRPPLAPSLSPCVSPSHTLPAHACKQQQLLSRMRASPRPSSPSHATPASHQSLARLRTFSPSPPSKEHQQQQQQQLCMSPFFKRSTTAANLLGWLPAAPMSPFAAAAAAASVRAAASAPSSPSPALSTAALPPVATMTPVAAPSSAPPALTAEETPTPPTDTSPPHTAEAPFLPSETPYPPTTALAPASGGDASVTAFMTAAAAPAPIHAPQPHKPLPPCPQNHSNTHGQCAPPCAVSPCEPSCLAQRKGPLEVDIPQGPWPGASPEAEQPSQRDLKCGMLPLAQSEGEEGRAQNVEAEQPSPTLSLPTPEQQQQQPVSRRILSADS